MSAREPSHEDLHDLAVAIEGLGFEVEALNQTLRELLSVAEVGLGVDPPPSWMNESSAEATEAEPLDQGRSDPPLLAEQDGRVAGYIVLAALVGSVAIIMSVLYVIGS